MISRQLANDVFDVALFEIDKEISENSEQFEEALDQYRLTDPNLIQMEAAVKSMEECAFQLVREFRDTQVQH